MTDVIVIGGGVIGLSIAYEMAGQGVAVEVIEQGQFGREASWAGAGMLPPGNPAGIAHPAEALRAYSHDIWPALSEQLHEETGIDNGYRLSGCIEVSFDEDSHRLADEIAAWRQEGVDLETLSTARLRQLEPALNPEIAQAYRLPHMAQVRNPRHMKALLAGCAARGVELIAGEPVVDFDVQGERVTAVRTTGGEHRAERYCVAAGAWTKRLMEAAGYDMAVAPVRGQIVMLRTMSLPFTHMLQIGSRYLVPRPDGRILVGSTEEHVGFDKRTTAQAVRDLIQLAIEIVPELGRAMCEKHWAGLRPGSADALPYLGRVPQYDNLFVAAGHFRSGLQMSPATALVMRQLMLGENLAFPLDAFACDRAAVASLEG